MYARTHTNDVALVAYDSFSLFDNDFFTELSVYAVDIEVHNSEDSIQLLMMMLMIMTKQTTTMTTVVGDDDYIMLYIVQLSLLFRNFRLFCLEKYMPYFPFVAHTQSETEGEREQRIETR